MIKSDSSFNPESCRVFGTAAHTLAALLHNLKQTRRARRPKKSNNIAEPFRVSRRVFYLSPASWTRFCSRW